MKAYMIALASTVCLGGVTAYSQINPGTIGYLARYSASTAVNSSTLIYDNTTNIGIGTTSPGSRLEIKGTTANNTASGLSILNSSSSSLFYVRNDGLIGAGTTSPAALLHTSSTANNSYALNLRLEKNTGTNQDNYLDAIITSNPAGANFTAGAGSFSFRMNNTYGTSDMIFMQNPTTLGFILKSSGNFGIGTVNPLCTFEVQGALSLFTTSTGNPTSAAVIRGNNGYSSATTPDYAWWNNDQTGFFHPSANVIGFTTGGGERMRVDGSGHVGINTTNTGTAAYLTVNGKMLVGDPSVVNLNTTYAYGLYVQNGVLTSKVRVSVVNSATWADYVFDPSYQLRSLKETERFVKENKHLPEIPSASEVQQDGIDMVTMDAALLKKIEELTLYIIDQDKRIEALEQQVQQGKTSTPKQQ
jgi:hypothetical protein